MEKWKKLALQDKEPSPKGPPKHSLLLVVLFLLLVTWTLYKFFSGAAQEVQEYWEDSDIRASDQPVVIDAVNTLDGAVQNRRSQLQQFRDE